jgi:hypothetical protein
MKGQASSDKQPEFPIFPSSMEQNQQQLALWVVGENMSSWLEKNPTPHVKNFYVEQEQ